MKTYRKREPMMFKPVMTLEQIAELMGITRERVRQIEESALRNARKVLRKKGYNPDAFFSDPTYKKPIQHNPDAPESEFELIEPERKEDD
jgi:transcriptional regulator with XRE-family HTH domain